ncbi:hypothetical protein H2248_011047 [Termitomyces sp. 'cryptogamus']|nr:hypothetical protein H2248_011047 [Termitomyces sp. 'cryptogamus']
MPPLPSIAQLAAIALVLAPSLASAAIFPKDTLVKMIDPKGFKRAMKTNQTSMVAFVAPWCGHCQRMAPEYSKAAIGLHPLIPVYAVDCDADANKRLCAEQGVKGFPTVKLFPRGNQLGSMTYESGERTASAFFYWASRRVPNSPTKLYEIKDIAPWVEKTSTKHRALLLTKDTKIPLLWKVLSNKYKDQLELGTHRDREGKSSEVLGLEGGGKGAKVLIYPAGSTKFVRYEGLTKFDSLSKFFDSVLDGSADLSALNEPASAEEYVPDAKEPEPEPEIKEVKTETEAETKASETPAPQISQVVADDGSEQVILDHPKDEVQKPASTGGQCAPAKDGPGAEAQVECDPPAVTTSERPVDEL